MARTTDPTFRNQTIYSIFIRNYSTSGDFAGVLKDLDRVADLGVDIIWLLPIHPIGSDKRKGGSGSPYAISNGLQSSSVPAWHSGNGLLIHYLPREPR
jgi:alpha-amylase